MLGGKLFSLPLRFCKFPEHDLPTPAAITKLITNHALLFFILEILFNNPFSLVFQILYIPAQRIIGKPILIYTVFRRSKLFGKRVNKLFRSTYLFLKRRECTGIHCHIIFKRLNILLSGGSGNKKPVLS